MGKWNRFLDGILKWAPIAVDLTEAAGTAGSAAAHHAAHIVAEAIGLDDLQGSEKGDVAKGIKMVNDGIVLIQHGVGTYTHTPKGKQTRPGKYPKHTGGGWYLLSNGEKAHGKISADAAQAALTG